MASSGDEGAKKGDPSAPYYGTFGSPTPQVGFPQPTAPPGVFPSPPPPSAPSSYYPHGYQSVPAGYVAEGTPVNVIARERRLPCCGIGLGWFLFIVGFFLASIPWYVGACILLFSRVDPREKPGYIACTVGAIISAIAIVLGATKGADAW